jgi:hypothetical protein
MWRAREAPRRRDKSVDARQKMRRTEKQATSDQRTHSTEPLSNCVMETTWLFGKSAGAVKGRAWADIVAAKKVL